MEFALRVGPRSPSHEPQGARRHNDHDQDHDQTYDYEYTVPADFSAVSAFVHLAVSPSFEIHDCDATSATKACTTTTTVQTTRRRMTQSRSDFVRGDSRGTHDAACPACPTHILSHIHFRTHIHILPITPWPRCDLRAVRTQWQGRGERRN